MQVGEPSIPGLLAMLEGEFCFFVLHAAVVRLWSAEKKHSGCLLGWVDAFLGKWVPTKMVTSTKVGTRINGRFAPNDAFRLYTTLAFPEPQPIMDLLSQSQ